jgi:hypothetical protein
MPSMKNDLKRGSPGIGMSLTAALMIVILRITPNAFGQLPPDTCIVSTWTADRPVNSIVPDGGIVYIGGDFSKVGRFAAGCAEFDASTGVTEFAFEHQPAVCNFNYTCAFGVEAFSACSDGKGGLYIQDQGIRHVLPDGTIDTNWLRELSRRAYCMSEAL